MNASRTILVVSPDTELVEWWLEDLGAEPGADGSPAIARFSDTELRFVVADPSEPDALAAEADAMVGLVRHVDVLSLQQMDESLRGASKPKALPSAVLVYRNENESDFKMSCPFCGQKLWVRDADVDKRGRCPHCRKSFTLPNQEDHVRASLRLPKGVPVLRVMRNDAGSFAGPMRKILSLKPESVLDHLEVPSQAASRQTMNVDIDDAS